MQVEVHHSEVRPLQRKLLLSLDDPTPSDRLDKVAKNVHDKQLLYDIISKLLSSQVYKIFFNNFVNIKI
jgi:hypothetical protein